MAKTFYNKIGAVLKSKNPGDSDYIKIGDKDVVLKAGTTLRLDSKAGQIKSLEAAYKAEKLSKENYEKAKARIDKIPEWVRFDVVQVVKNEG